MTELRVIGDDLLLDGQPVAKLLPCVAASNSLRHLLEGMTSRANRAEVNSMFGGEPDTDRSSIREEIRLLRGIASDMPAGSPLVNRINRSISSLTAALN